jgi:aminoglycoside 6'-N-acetyltransferase I
MVRIRQVEPADSAQWLALRAALWPDENAAELAVEVARFFAEPSAQPGAMLEAVLVAVDSDEPAARLIGFAELSRRPYADGCATSPVGYLEGWYVRPEQRGRGVGRALVAAAEAWARAQGCHELASDTELENTRSAAAHRALGFEEVTVLRCFRKALAPEGT